MTFITYHGEDGELIITTPELEAEMIKEWFVKGGRDLEVYDRHERNDEAISVSAEVRIN